MMSCARACLLSRVRLLVTLWTVAYQASLSMGFSRQEYWSGLPFPPQEDLPNPGIKLKSPAPSALQAESLTLEPSGSPQWRHVWHHIPGVIYDEKGTSAPQYFSKNPQSLSKHEKNIRQNKNGRHSIRYLASLPQDTQGCENQEKTKKLSQVRKNQGRASLVAQW